MKRNFKTFEEMEVVALELQKEEKYIVRGFQKDNEFILNWIELKNYTAFDGKTYPDEVWETQSGEIMFIQDMSPEHVRNALRMIISNQREMRKAVQELGEEYLNSLNGDNDEPLSESHGHTLH